MKHDFKFVNIAGGAYSELVDVTSTAVATSYQSAVEAAKTNKMFLLPNLWGDDDTLGG